MIHPKPERRVPRPKRRIARVKPPARGKRPNRRRKTSRGAQGRLADKLFATIVKRSGQCFMASNMVPRAFVDHACRGSLQTAHIVSRRYRSTRWDEDNAIPLCAGAHRYFTGRQCEWDVFVMQNIMPEGDYDNLRYVRALRRWDQDIEGVLVRLAARAVSLGIRAEG